MIPSGGGSWSWKSCDFPSLVYALVKMGMEKDPRVLKSLDCLTGYSFENGWPCVMSRDIERFFRPGPHDDPCPIVNIIALKTLALLPEWRESQSSRWGVDNLLTLWEQRRRVRCVSKTVTATRLPVYYATAHCSAKAVKSPIPTSIQHTLAVMSAHCWCPTARHN